MRREIASSVEARSLIGEPLGSSRGFTVDQTRIDAFAEATGDRQWIHVDPERATSGPFGTTIAHGYLTLSLIPLMAADIYSLTFGSARLNYGCNKVRFPSPVPAGATLRASAEFVEVRREKQGTFVTTRFTITADGARRPACVAESVALVLGEEDDA